MYAKWMSLKKEIGELTERLHEIEADIWVKANELGQINPTGSKTFEVDGFKVTITHKDTVSVDQGIASLYPELFKLKFEYSKTMEKTFAPAEIAKLNEAITIKPAKPGFKVERV
jgi:hypothetical protein